jgi:hypothetical protein
MTISQRKLLAFCLLAVSQTGFAADTSSSDSLQRISIRSLLKRIEEEDRVFLERLTQEPMVEGEPKNIPMSALIEYAHGGRSHLRNIAVRRVVDLQHLIKEQSNISGIPVDCMHVIHKYHEYPGSGIKIVWRYLPPGSAFAEVEGLKELRTNVFVVMVQKERPTSQDLNDLIRGMIFAYPGNIAKVKEAS